MDSRQAKKILKIAVVIYFVAFLVINWSDVSWIFNYREVYGLVSDFFNPYPSIDARQMDAYFYPNHSQVAQTTYQAERPKEAKTTYTDKQNTLEIPKISIEAPIIFSANAEKSTIIKDLDAGVVYYPGSVYPGQTGQIIILGHSAPPGWPKVKHDWVFTDLDKLVIGDEIHVDLNNKQYTYIVRKKNIINRGADVPSLDSGNNGNILALVSCWPPGKDYQRIAVMAELQMMP